MKRLRIGQGVDFHRYCSRRVLMLCGLRIDGEPGLDGYSDADVALHAVTDAILGAVAGGDIGEHFPTDDDKWRNVDSSVFVTEALGRAAAEGFKVGNCDLTVVGERPRIAPLRAALRASLAKVLGVDVSVVSVKATTTDGLGFAGRGEGLGAIAVVLMEEAGGHG
ncbi:MAG: 2-C-methyl-D-erythritol 2,4-cyclodiphosphate synthase [Acidobacteriota bacterium]|nr:2-C-methyl-D-erythritol 2,4-cyclodiphosphate synthase [Acidobacteriota bacterium]